jgi:hypothetical protein
MFGRCDLRVLRLHLAEYNCCARGDYVLDVDNENLVAREDTGQLADAGE